MKEYVRRVKVRLVDPRRFPRPPFFFSAKADGISCGCDVRHGAGGGG
jgi:hypothetical protein